MLLQKNNGITPEKWGNISCKTERFLSTGIPKKPVILSSLYSYQTKVPSNENPYQTTNSFQPVSPLPKVPSNDNSPQSTNSF